MYQQLNFDLIFEKNIIVVATGRQTESTTLLTIKPDTDNLRTHFILHDWVWHMTLDWDDQSGRCLNIEGHKNLRRFFEEGLCPGPRSKEILLRKEKKNLGIFIFCVYYQGYYDMDSYLRLLHTHTHTILGHLKFIEALWLWVLIFAYPMQCSKAIAMQYVLIKIEKSFLQCSTFSPRLKSKRSQKEKNSLLFAYYSHALRPFSTIFFLNFRFCKDQTSCAV